MEREAAGQSLGAVIGQQGGRRLHRDPRHVLMKYIILLGDGMADRLYLILGREDLPPGRQDAEPLTSWRTLGQVGTVGTKLDPL